MEIIFCQMMKSGRGFMESKILLILVQESNPNIFLPLISFLDFCLLQQQIKIQAFLLWNTPANESDVKKKKEEVFFIFPLNVPLEILALNGTESWEPLGCFINV